MRIEFSRKTLREEVRFSGVGIHSGEFSEVTVAPGDEGIWFSHAGKRLQARPANITDTSRSTSLGEVRMIEHLMSAFAAHGITDAEVNVSANELPILDGGALEYFAGLAHAGARELGQAAVRMFSRVNVQDGPQRIGISVGNGRWRYTFEREEAWPGEQTFEALLPNEFAEAIAPAKTFAFEDEIESLRKAGLGMGGSPENTLVIGRQGYLTAGRFTDEPPRHKLLDCIGDIYLSGVPIGSLNVAAERTGHKMNIEAAGRLVETCEWED